MDPIASLIDQTGVALTREMLALGASERQIHTATRDGVLRRIRHGAYTTPERWAAAGPEERHVLRATAVARVLGPGAAMSHTTSLLLQGIPVWGADLEHVHVTRAPGMSGRTAAGVRHHEGTLADDEVLVLPNGLSVTRPLRAVVEHASVASAESGLVSANAGLHAGLFTPDDLRLEHEQLAQWPGMQRLQIVVRLADGRCESPGESRTLFLCWRHGLPAPELQWEVHDGGGRLLGRTDFAWPELGVLGEFDGLAKYERLRAPGQTVADVVVAEKRREDLIRLATGWRFLRLVWADLQRPVQTAMMIREVLGLRPVTV